MLQSSLKRCVVQAAHLHAHGITEQIAIIRYPKSKNYKCATERELKQILDHEKDQGQQIILNCTGREFRYLTQSDQYQLFPEPKNAD